MRGMGATGEDPQMTQPCQEQHESPGETCEETETGPALVLITFRLRLRLRTRYGIVNEVLVKTQNANPRHLDPLRLELQVLHDGGTWVSMRQSRMDFELDVYDEATRTATYKPFEIRRSDRRFMQLLDGWEFSRERSGSTQ